jgi:hypothetical protein
MSVNREKPHIWLVPEDDANRQVANGFLQSLDVFAREPPRCFHLQGAGDALWIRLVTK